MNEQNTKWSEKRKKWAERLLEWMIEDENYAEYY